MKGSLGLDVVRTGFWALVGAVIVLFVFFAAVGGFDPTEAVALTIVVAVLAVLWLGRFLLIRGRVQDNRFNRADRERRGF